jgi:hypothetical protein
MKRDCILGIQMSPISMLHEGCDNVYKLLSGEAGLNSVFIYCSTYQICNWERNKKGCLASDHGVLPPDFDYSDTRNTWFEPNPKYYKNSPFFRSEDEGRIFADRDVFREALESAEKYGFRVFARALESEYGHLVIPGWQQIATVDCYGKPTYRPCPNNPDYQRFWGAAMEDLFKSYPRLAGMKMGSERPGPLSLAVFRGPFWYSKLLPDCFCPHCQKKLREKGIDPERSRAGFRELVEYAELFHSGSMKRGDGALVGALRILGKYPEVLAHNREFLRSIDEFHAGLSGIIHTIKPDALFGLHIYQGATSWDFIHRATIDYEDMVHYIDFLKPVIYEAIAGPRMVNFINSIKTGIFSDFDEEMILQMLYHIQGFKGPSFKNLSKEGFGYDYAYSETKRCVDALAGRALTLAGPGFDIGQPSEMDSPERVERMIDACFAAGADGLIVSREYDEMQRKHLQAVGKAVQKYL